MHKLIEYISDEIMSLEKKAGSGKLSMQELQYADTLARVKKNLMKCEEMDGGEGYSGNYSGNYSERRYSTRGGYSRNDGRSYDGRSYDGNSYDGPGRGPNAARDRFGRYSSTGYSMDGEDMIDELRELMDKAPDEQKRQEFKRFIEKLERM